MTIRNKLMAAHATMAAIAMILFASFAFVTEYLHEEFEEITELSSQTVAALVDIQLSGERIVSSTNELTLLLRLHGEVDGWLENQKKSGIETEHIEREESRNRRAVERLQSAIIRYSDLVDTHFPDEIATRDAVVTSARQFITASAEIIEIAKIEPDAIAILRNVKEIETLEDDFVQTIAIVLEDEAEEWREKRGRINATMALVHYAGLMVGGLVVASVFAIGWLVSRSISRPLGELVLAADRIGRGEFDTPLEIHTRGEIGNLVSSFRKMTQRLAGMRKDLENQIDERNRAQDMLKQRASELERSNAELETFAYVASHDLQEPLRKVQTFGDRLKSKYAEVLDERGLDYLSRMQDAAERMQTLIQSLLSFSRIGTNAEPHVPVDLDAVVQEVVGDLEVRIQETGAKVEVGDLPTIEADPTQMRQIFQNLIGNALKYRREGVATVVRVSAEVLDGAAGPLDGTPTKLCRIRFEDNGIGFEPQFADRIFGIFQRLHGRGEFEGTGVGLAICRKIAERHGGTISAEGRPGAGSCFTVTLPFDMQERSHG